MSKEIEMYIFIINCKNILIDFIQITKISELNIFKLLYIYFV